MATDRPVPMLAQSRILPLTRIRRERLLPTRGEVSVSMGARLGAQDIIANSEAPMRLLAVPIARYLRVPESRVAKYIKKKPGDAVQVNDVIASKPELFGALQRVYAAPAAGKIIAVQGSWLSLETAEQAVELVALYRGTVVNVMPRLGVVVEAVGALIQGIWGAGGEANAVLKMMVSAPDEILIAHKIDVSVRNAILVAGGGITADVLRSAVKEQAAGLIVGGLNPNLRALVAELRFPTLVTDGLGTCPMSAPVFELLSSQNGAEVSINTSSKSLERPEVFMPAIASGSVIATALPPPTLMADVGVRVRVLAGEPRGEIGKISAIPLASYALPSGVSAWGAEIELARGKVFVQWENMELID